MAKGSKEGNGRVPTLKDPVILYADGSSESDAAKALLKDAGISPFVTEGRVEPLERKPLVLYNGGTYQGIDEIRSLLQLLSFWVSQPVCSLVFKNEEACDAPL